MYVQHTLNIANTCRKTNNSTSICIQQPALPTTHVYMTLCMQLCTIESIVCMYTNACSILSIGQTICCTVKCHRKTPRELGQVLLTSLNTPIHIHLANGRKPGEGVTTFKPQEGCAQLALEIAPLSPQSFVRCAKSRLASAVKCT